MTRRALLAWFLGLLGGFMTWRPWIVGSNPLEPIGSGNTDGVVSRIVDPVTGAGLFNPNTDPNVVGVDPLTGADALAGTDVGFGAAVRRFLTAGVYNGDFAAPPDDIARRIDTDPSSGEYNPLPLWLVFTGGAGKNTGYGEIIADTSASGYALRITLNGAGASDEWGIRQYIPVNGSKGRSFTYLPSVYWSARTGTGDPFIRGQYLKADGTTTGSAVTTVGITSPDEVSVNVGQVPADAYYLQLDLGGRNGTGTLTFSEVRCLQGSDRVLIADEAASIDGPGVVVKAGGSLRMAHRMSTEGYADSSFVLLETGGVTLDASDGSTGVIVNAATAGLHLTGLLRMEPVYPAQITANQNDYSPSGLSAAAILFLDANGSYNITGMAGGDDGRVVWLVNTTTGATLTLPHNSVSSAAANRWRCPGGVNYSLTNRKAIMAVYDGNASRWQIVG